MTCASCVNRIERFLRATDGVQSATVNLATEIATIRYLPEVADRSRLVGAVEAAGYDVRPQEPSSETADPAEADGWSLVEEAAREDARRDAAAAVLLRQALTSIAVAIGIMVAILLWRHQGLYPVTSR